MWLSKILQAVACRVPVQSLAPLSGRPCSEGKRDLYSPRQVPRALQGPRGLPALPQWARPLDCFLSCSCPQVVVFEICDKVNHRLLNFCLYTLQCEPVIKELSFCTNECVFGDWGREGGQTLNRPRIFPALNTLNSLVSNKSCWYCDQLGLL